MSFEHWLAIGIGLVAGILVLWVVLCWRNKLWPPINTLADPDEGPNLLATSEALPSWEPEQKYDKFKRQVSRTATPEW